MVYDITKKESFLNVQRWLGELKERADPNCVVMLVGNKIDLVLTDETKRQVNYEEAKAFADEKNLIFFETSAMSNFKVKECFEDLMQEIFNVRKRLPNQENNNIVLSQKNNDRKVEKSSCLEC